MSVRSFHSVFMATAVAGAALGCYLVSLRVASERAALEQVEAKIVATQADIRLLQTEIGTRARLSQLERWNVRALALSAPSADQILGDKFQLAKLVRPDQKPQLQAPVVMASAPASAPAPMLAEDPDADVAVAAAGDLLHEASVKLPTREEPQAQPAPAEPKALQKKAGEKTAKSASTPVTKSVLTAKTDPLAPLPREPSKAKGSRTER